MNNERASANYGNSFTCCEVGDSSGHKRGQGGQNGYTSWGDYFLMKALNRELKGEEIFR